jgi:hypothetical protein
MSNRKLKIANGQSGLEYELQITIYPLENKNKYLATSEMDFFLKAFLRGFFKILRSQDFLS